MTFLILPKDYKLNTIIIKCKYNQPVLTTTSEQRAPVYNGQPDPQLFNIDSNF
jgi:hypothetical protein